jgi:PAS domain S-box-containing protein
MPQKKVNNKDNKSASEQDGIFKGLVESAIDSIITIDEMGHIESFNPAAEKLFQYTAQEVIGKNIKMLMPSPYSDEHDGYLHHYRTTGEKKIIGRGREVEALRKDGSLVPIHLSVSEAKIGARRVFVGIAHDITALKEKEYQVEEKQQRFENLINSAVDAIITIDHVGHIKSFNSSAERLFGYEQDEILGQNVKILMPSPYQQEHDQYLDNYMKTGEKKIIGSGREVVAKHKDGSEIPVFLSISEFLVGEAKFFTGIVRDLSELKQKQEELQNVIEQAIKIADGDFNLEIQPTNEDDKLGLALSNMVLSLRDKARVAKEIAEGDLSARVTISSEDDMLGISLNTMIDKISESIQSNEKESWIKTGQSGVAEAMGADQNIIDLSRSIITYLAKYLEAQVGVFYVANEHEELTLLSSYAFTQRKHLVTTIKPGEGLVGQAALEKQIIMLKQVPDDYIQVSSSLGETSPHNIIVVPILTESEVLGVMELGTMKEFTEIQVELLERIIPSVGMALIACREKDNTKSLLEETQRQSEALQSQTEEMEAQQEELRSANEGLKQKSEEMAAQQEELRASNDELSKKTQELNAQQEELRLSNDGLRNKTAELEDQRNTLEESRKELDQKAKDLEVSGRYKSEFLANMSHELRTPLNSIIILSELLAANKKDNLNEKQIESAQTIYSSGNDLLNLINDILDLSKVESGKLEITPELVKLDAITDTLKSTFSALMEAKGLRFKLEVNQACPPSIQTDKMRVDQILKNFVSNALKFTKEGTVSVTIRKTGKSDQLINALLDISTAIAIEVRDSGIGIAPEQQETIFEAFQQADSSISRRFAGTGLGLSVARGLAALLGGEVQLSSQTDKGSIFTLFLPEYLEVNSESILESITPNTAQEPQVQVESVTQAKPKMVTDSIQPNTPKDAVAQKKPGFIKSSYIDDDRDSIGSGDRVILIIEDDKNFATILRDQCHEHKLKCLIASNGEDGIGLLEQHPPNAILLDIRLPGMSGLTILKRLKGSPNTRHIPVQIISVEDTGEKILSLGAIGFLSKPVKKNELEVAITTLERHMGHHTGKILLVEDDEVQSNAIVQLLEIREVEIVQATSVKAALKELETNDFDCIITDLMLGGDSGFELFDELEKNKDKIYPPVIVYTGKDLTKDEQKLLEHHSSSIIIKGARSPERLLEDTLLFLHKQESQLPQEKQTLLEDMRHRDDSFDDKKILIVDDDMRNVFSLKQVLDDIGFEAVVANTGMEALEQLKNHPDIDIVLMDIMMPEMDGFEATRQIRQQLKLHDLPIIALTAKAMKGDREECLAAGATDYLPKPVDIEQLLSLLRIWLSV